MLLVGPWILLSCPIQSASHDHAFSSSEIIIGSRPSGCQRKQNFNKWNVWNLIAESLKSKRIYDFEAKDAGCVRRAWTFCFPLQTCGGILTPTFLHWLLQPREDKEHADEVEQEGYLRQCAIVYLANPETVFKTKPCVQVRERKEKNWFLTSASCWSWILLDWGSL